MKTKIEQNGATQTKISELSKEVESLHRASSILTDLYTLLEGWKPVEGSLSSEEPLKGCADIDHEVNGESTCVSAQLRILTDLYEPEIRKRQDEINKLLKTFKR